MLNLTPNINKREGYVRLAVGVLLILGVLARVSAVFSFIIGAVLIAEFFLNYCFIADLIRRFNLDNEHTPPPPPPQTPPSSQL